RRRSLRPGRPARRRAGLAVALDRGRGRARRRHGPPAEGARRPEAGEPRAAPELGIDASQRRDGEGAASMTRRSSDKRPEEIEEEIAQTRADMDSTLDAIQRKLSPPELLEQALAYVRENGGEKMMKSVGSMVRDNPIPVALIGAGMAWFMYSAARRRNGGMYEE